MIDAEPTQRPIAPPPADSGRRRLLTLLGLGGLAAGLAGLPGVEPVEAKKKKKKKKGKGKGKGKGNKGGGGGTCNGSIVGAAPATDADILLTMMNDFRAQNGRGPLRQQENLNTAARLHSQDMISRCYFDHINPDGTDPFQRMQTAGYPGVPLAENIYKGSGSLGSAAQAFDAWKNSEGHRINMLDPDSTEIGIGTALDGAGWMNWTNVFGRPR